MHSANRELAAMSGDLFSIQGSNLLFASGCGWRHRGEDCWSNEACRCACSKVISTGMMVLFFGVRVSWNGMEEGWRVRMVAIFLEI